MEKNISREERDNLFKQDEIIICDWDGVIQFIDLSWCLYIKENKAIFEPYFEEKFFDLIGSDLMLPYVFGRKEYYLNKAFLKEGIDRLPKNIYDKFMSIYTNNEFFYYACVESNLAKNLFTMIENKFIKKIIFLSHTPNKDGKDQRKNNELEKLLNQYDVKSKDKIEFVSINDSIPKFKWILDNQPDYTTFIDDRDDIVADVIKFTNSKNKTFLIPEYGYNHHSEKIKGLNKDADIIYYIPQIV